MELPSRFDFEIGTIVVTALLSVNANEVNEVECTGRLTDFFVSSSVSLAKTRQLLVGQKYAKPRSPSACLLQRRTVFGSDRLGTAAGRRVRHDDTAACGHFFSIEYR